MCISKVTAFTIPLRFKICLVKTDIESVHISKDIQFNELFLTSTIETKFSPSLLSYILCDMKYVETPQPQEIKKKSLVLFLLLTQGTYQMCLVLLTLFSHHLNFKDSF